MTHRWCARLVLTVALALVACPSADEPSELVECDPLAPLARDRVELREVLAVGRQDDGRLLVVDADPEGGHERLFVSQAGDLVEQATSGTSSSSQPGVRSIAISSSTEPRLTVIVEQRGGATRMEVVTGDWDRSFELDLVSGEELEVLDESAIDGMVAHKLPADLRVEYVARVDDASLLVVLSPVHDFNFEDFRVFFGTEQRVIERPLISVVRARDGGSTHVAFELGDEAADAFFPNRILGPGEVQAPVTFTVGDMDRPIERLANDAAVLEDVAFTCAQ